MIRVQDSTKAYQGLADKVKLIETYYSESLRSPSVRKTAEKFSLDDFNKPNVAALFIRLRSHFRYVSDPVGNEYIKAPWVQTREIDTQGFTMGDCDDAASLSYCLLHSLGVPAKLAVGWYGHEDPSHIWTEIETADGWLAFDLCAPQLGVKKLDGLTRIERYG